VKAGTFAILTLQTNKRELTAVSQKEIVLEKMSVRTWHAKNLLADLRNYAEAHNCYNAKVKDDYSFYAAIVLLNSIVKDAAAEDLRQKVLLVREMWMDASEYIDKLQEQTSLIIHLQDSFNTVFKNRN
jgi:hypothetical protein